MTPVRPFEKKKEEAEEEEEEEEEYIRKKNKKNAGVKNLTQIFVPSLFPFFSAMFFIN